MCKLNQDKGLSRWEYLRFITPILVTIALFYLSSISKKVDSIDDKLFKHLTNDEMHSPRSITVSKNEFDFYQKYREAQMAELKEMITEIRTHVRNESGRMDKK